MAGQEGIEEWVKRQTVLISGGSGFLGKVFIYKLLKCGCSKIFVLLRGKKNMTCQERLKLLMNDSIYEKLREADPDFDNKVVGIDSTLTEIGLGLSEQDRTRLHQEVTAVFHVAASVRFDDPLKEAVLTNMRPTRDMVELAKGMKNLQVFQHVSTAYCNLDRIHDTDGIKEKLYETKMDWRKLIKVCEILPEESVGSLEKQLLASLPNTYLFTKNLAEHIVNDAASEIPTVITRPAVVMPSLEEPDPGWLDNLSSPCAIALGSGKGVMRVVAGDVDKPKTYTAVDIVVNYCISASWSRASVKRDAEEMGTPVYNIPGQFLTQVEFNDILHSAMDQLGMTNAIWYPNLVLANTPLKFDVFHVLLHFLPGLIFDGILKMAGQRPRLSRINRKMYAALTALQPVLFSKDKFETKKTEQLLKYVALHEKNHFPITWSLTHDQFREYLIHGSVHTRRFLKEPPLCRADIQHLHRLWWLDRGFKAAILLLALKVFPFQTVFSLVIFIISFIFPFELLQPI